MKLKFTILSIFVGINFCYAQNDIIYSQNKEALEKEYLQIESQLKPNYHLDEYGNRDKKYINCDLMISTFILASKALEVEKDYIQLFCDKDNCIYTINHNHFAEMFQKIQDAKKSPNFEAFRSWFKSPFSNNKERKKSDLFETFNIIVDKLSIPQEKKVELKNYCTKLKVEFKKEYGSDKIVPYYKYLLIKELKYLPINMGDFCAIIESQHVSLRFLDDKVKENDNRYYEQVKVNFFEDKGFLTKMILKSINVLYDHNCLPKIDEHTEGQLFVAKYLYDQASFKEENYINRIKNIPYYSSLTKFLFSEKIKSKEMDFLFHYRVLSLLKESGLKEINNLTYNNEETINIDLAIKSIIKQYLEEEVRSITRTLKLKSYNSCFMSKIGGYDDEKTLLSENFGSLNLDLFNSNFNEKDYEIKIINTGNDFKIEKEKNSENSKKNQTKKYSELTDDEKLKFSDQYLRALKQNEANEKLENQERISSLKNIDNLLYFIFRNDTVIMNKTLMDFYKNYRDLNSIRNKEKINSISKYFYDNQTSSEDDSPQIDSIKNMLVIFMSYGSGDTIKNVPEISSMQFVKQMIDWVNQTHNNFYAAKNYLAKKAIGKYKSILDQLSSENDEIAFKSAMEKFDNIYLSNMNDINPEKTSFGGDCRYRADGFESGDGELTISKGNTFFLYGDITSSLGGSINASCSGKIIKSENGSYILQSNSGDYKLELIQGKCKKIYMELNGLGKNSKISFLLNWK